MLFFERMYMKRVLYIIIISIQLLPQIFTLSSSDPASGTDQFKHQLVFEWRHSVRDFSLV